MDTIQSFIVAQNDPGATTATSSPPTAVPKPGLDHDGGLILQVAIYWALALVVVFSVFAMMPKLRGNVPKRRDEHFA
jgi:hypothetical protein